MVTFVVYIFLFFEGMIYELMQTAKRLLISFGRPQILVTKKMSSLYESRYLSPEIIKLADCMVAPTLLITMHR